MQHAHAKFGATLDESVQERTQLVRQAREGPVRVQLDTGIELPADKKDGMARTKQGVANQPEVGSSINNGS